MNFPESTLVNKMMPKEAFYKNITLKSEIKSAFVSDIKRIIWKNKLSSDTLNIDKGEKVSEILVLQIELKVKKYNQKILETISKNNSHNILYILTIESKTQIALFYNKLYKTEWQNDTFDIEIKGLNMDSVWENFIIQVGGVEVGQGKSLDEQIELDDQKEKLMKEIAKLEKQARSEKQPNKKFELAQKINKLKKEMLS